MKIKISLIGFDPIKKNRKFTNKIELDSSKGIKLGHEFGFKSSAHDSNQVKVFGHAKTYRSQYND